MSIAARAAKTITWTFDPTVSPDNDIIRERVLMEPGRVFNGSNVTVDKALGFIPVLAAVRVISETVASLPLQVYRRLEGGGREVNRDHRIYDMLHSIANPEMTSFIYRETAQSHIETWGNHYAEIEYDTDGFPLHLWPMRPDSMEVFREKGQLVYLYTLPDGTQARLSRRNVFHVPGLGFNGLIGHSPIHMARKGLALGMAAEEFAGRFYDNDARPGVAIKLGPEFDYDDDAKKRLAESWDATHSGLGNKHRTAVLDEGMGIEQIGFPAEDAQLIEQQKWSIPTISRVFNLSPHMLHDLERATFSNIEEQGINVTTYQFRPRLVRWEQQGNMQLLADDRAHFIEHNIDGLLRGKLEDRMKAYWQQFQMSSISPNEIRAKENMNPIEGGDVYYVPVNIAAIPEESQEIPSLPPLQLATRSTKGVEDRRKVADKYRPLFERVTRQLIEFESEQVLAEAERRAIA